MKRLLCVALLLFVLVVPPAGAAPVTVPDAPMAAISLVGGAYSENFDTLAYTPDAGTGSVLPTGWALYETGTGANTTYGIGTGSSNSGNTYSFGVTGTIERAFGELRSGSVVPIIGAEFSNGTDATISSLAVSYNCEQWRIGVSSRGAADRMDLQYSLDATSLSTGTWIDVDALDCYSTVTSGTAGALNGNTNRTAVSGSVTGLSIASGAGFWLRWTDWDIAPGADDGLAVDDFSITPSTAVADTAPTIISTTPTNGASNVAVNTNITVTFSEPVTINNIDSFFDIFCEVSGVPTQQFGTGGGSSTTFTINPTNDLPAGSNCTVTIKAAEVVDQDTNDPPDNMDANYVWSFTTDTPPAVTSTTPANAATGVAPAANITVNFNEPVTVNISSFFDIFCEVMGVPTLQPGTASGGPTSFTIDPTADLPAGSVCTVTIKAAQVTDQDAPLDNMAANYTWNFTVIGGLTKIHAIQGSGSAATPGTFTVEAIVTGDYQGATGVDDFKLDGFFIQEEDADVDGNPATSEGIFVYCATCPTNVTVGDKVQITGMSSEYFDMSQLNATTGGAIVVVSSGNTLPSPAAITLPVPGVTATDLAGAQTQINAYYEPFEGMLVQMAAQLSVTEYFELFRYGQVVLAQGGRFRQFTDANAPSTTGYTAHQIDLARRKVILDDDSNQQNHALMETPDIPVFHPVPGFSTINYLRGGDTITNLTGVLHWSFAGLTGTDAWRIRPVTSAFSYAFTPGNPRPAAPAQSGSIKVASFNVLNYFTTLNSRGANSATEFTRQAAKIVAAITGLNADVIGVMEIENNSTAIADLVTKLNAAAGAGTYDYVSTGVVGTDQITVGIIYRPAKVTPIGAVQTLTVSAFVDPNNTGTYRNRPAVAQTFEEVGGGGRLTVVVNHLKSKGCGDETGLDVDQNDGQGCWNDTRQKAASYLANIWLPGDPTDSGDPDFLIIGDLNSYRLEDPITNITGAGYTDLVNSTQGASGYGYVFDGQLGYLDHALASPSLASQVAGLSEWHINADEVNLLDYNDTVQDPGEQVFDAKPTATALYEANAYRASDHDPVVIDLNLTPVNDLSDLPASYGAAWHTFTELQLGNLWEAGHSPVGGGSNDGVILTPGYEWPTTGTGRVGKVDVTVTGASGYVTGWFDWDKDGAFTGVGERVFMNVASESVEPMTIDVPIPDGVAIGGQSFYARFRVYPSPQEIAALAAAAGPGGIDAAPLPAGGATGGEVEDYEFGFKPTAVSLRNLSAAGVPWAGWPAAAGLGALAIVLLAWRRRK